MICWNCKAADYVKYDVSDEPLVPRCPLCGEREQDDPAKKSVARKAPVKRTKE